MDDEYLTHIYSFNGEFYFSGKAIKELDQVFVIFKINSFENSFWFPMKLSTNYEFPYLPHI